MSLSPEAKFVANAFAGMVSRYALANQLERKRDLNNECDYPETIDANNCDTLYKRDGIAKRVVTVYPEESWSVDPSVCETEDQNVETPFEKAWADLEDRQNILHYLERIDELSGVGRFGILLLGINDGLTLDQPVAGVLDEGLEWDEDDEVDGEPDDPKPAPDPKQPKEMKRKLLYLRALSEKYVTVSQWEADQTNPRYGQPLAYNVTLAEVGQTGMIAGQTPATQMVNVHWSRVIHVADNRKTSEVYGAYRMEPSFNRLCDIRKLLGGSAEMFWKGAFPGISFEIDPTIASAGAELDPDAVRLEFEKYSNGLQRYIATQGLHANSLAVQVADPENHLKVQLQAISIDLACPLRVFMGSEAGHLASDQDSEAWNKRLRRRQLRYLTPLVIRPFIDRLIMMKILPKPKKYNVEWPDLNTPKESDKADVALKKTQAAAAYVSGGVEQIIPLLEWLTEWMGLDQETAEFIVDAAKMNEDLLTDPGEDMIDSTDPIAVAAAASKQMPMDGTDPLAKPAGIIPKADPKDDE